MKIRLADYIADFLTERGITDCFTVTGGGAMHLNDAFGHHPGLKCTYNHHEQASAIAAEAYARLTNRMALLCVTTGPGGTNALTGVLGGWLDSIPMFVVSGQVRYDTTARYNARFTGEPLRAVGDQEFDITKAAGAMCKYAAMVEDPMDIRYHLERAFYMATTGRPGPVWLDVPVNFQGCTIETEELRGYTEFDRVKDDDSMQLPEPFDTEIVKDVLEQLRKAKRPVIYAGNGIRLAGAMEEFRRVVELLGVPVCTYWDAIDLMETDHPLYVGRGGNMGDRPGNFAIQNADLILAIGNRLPIRVTGYNWSTWARAAKVIMVDIDPGEMKKPTIHVEQAIHADARVFLSEMLETLTCDHHPEEPASACHPEGPTSACHPEEPKATKDLENASDDKILRPCGAQNDNGETSTNGKVDTTTNGKVDTTTNDKVDTTTNDKGEATENDWISICQNWKKKYPVVTEDQKAQDVPANPYAVFDIISRALPEGITTITSNGTCCVAGHQTWVIKKGSRFLNNNAVASMGYGLPAAIGAAVAERSTREKQNDPVTGMWDEKDASANEGIRKKKGVTEGHPYVVCLEGDGSIMMNLQELQTIATNHLPVKIFLINNEGYHSIRQTQTNLFGEHTKVGIGPESGDLGFPDFGKLADAFGIRYMRITGNRELERQITEILASDTEYTGSEAVGKAGAEGSTEVGKAGAEEPTVTGGAGTDLCSDQYGPLLCEIVVTTKQNFEPKSSTRRNPDGTLESPPLEDLAPFLPREELAENLFI